MVDSRARIWFSLFVLAVFCLGGAGGFFLGRHVPPRPPAGPGLFGGRGRVGPPLLGRGGAPALPPGLVNRLAAELQLDETQRSQVTKILDDRRARLDAVHREARERFGKEQRDLQEAIRAVLRPDQQAKFDNFLDRRQ